MSTRGLIGKLSSDGKVKVIYSHWDNYPSCNGAILLEHYTDPSKVDELLALGSISSLGNEIGEKQDFDNPTNKNWCLVYGRDRAERDTEANNFDSFEAFADKMLGDTWCEYLYIMTPDGEWKYTKIYRKSIKSIEDLELLTERCIEKD